jgi:peroxiredoxin Q/BCP
VRRDALEGRKAPAFRLPDQTGRKVSLASLRGRTVVLYFYPKDFTAGCTLEARDFRRLHARLKRLKAEVLGVSPDSVSSHARFAKVYRLPFRLLSDAGARTARRYGAYGRKSLYGRTFMGIVRSTFVIDGRGRICRVFRNVRAAGHAAEVVKAVRAL